MSTSLEERVSYILEDSDFNDLPKEERIRIRKYCWEEKIQTIMQILEKDKGITTELWRKRQRAWLKACVDSYLNEYGYLKEKAEVKR